MRLLAQNILFESISIEQGLSQGMIFDIQHTRDGFLWVATKDGLNRYDGYNFKVFSHDPYDAFSPEEDNATVLFEDSRGWMWIGTASKGVDVYNPKTGLFHHINPRFSPEKQMSFIRPRIFVEDRSGAIWVQYHDYGLVRINIPESWRQEGLPYVADLGGQTDFTLCSVPEWQTGREVWINMWIEPDGVITAFSSLRHYHITPDAKALAVPHSGLWPELIYSVESDERIGPGGFWMLGGLGKLYVFRDGKLSCCSTPKMNWVDKTYAIQRDHEHNVWLIYGPEIWKLDPAKPIDFTALFCTLDQSVKSIDTDKNGNIWIGTAGYGLRRGTPRFAAFHAGLAGKSVWRLWRSPKGSYYWRRDSDVFHYDPLTRKSATTQAFPELSDNWVRDLAFEESGAFWLLAAYQSGKKQMLLCRYGPNGQLEQRHTLPVHDYDYACFLRTRRGEIWINGSGCQLTRFKPQSAQNDQYSYAHLFKEKGSAVQAFAITEDGNGVLWLGTPQGLVQCTPAGQGMDFRLFESSAQDPNGLSHNNVSSLLPDPDQPGKVLWIGTKGGGINRLDIPTGRFQHYGLKDGLPDKVIYSILPGNEPPGSGHTSFWCSTNKGIVKLTPMAGKTNEAGKPFFSILTYTAAKGLQDNEFNTQAYYKSAQGELLFGGINGLNHFFPEQIRLDTSQLLVFVVGLEVNHQAALPGLWNYDTACALEYLRKLHLSYNQNNVSFEFAVLDLTDPSKNRYRYRLVGLDANWVENGTDRFAHFTHLAPGRYTFLVQGSNGESQWANLIAPIELVIHPPWYRSNLAYLLYLVFLLWAGWQVYQFQIRRVKLREQLAYEHRETERVKALEQMKTNFFSNITHEFRTPLTLMVEPLRFVMRKAKDPEILENVRLAEANSRQLLDLVNQLLYMAKMESGGMTLDLRRSDMSRTVRDVFERFLPLAEKRGVKLTLSVPPPDDLPSFDFDPGKVELVLNNLISNALKFTPKGGKVNVNIGRNFTPANVETVEIQVADTGIGIPPEALDKIFYRFYQVDDTHTRAGEGTGIGLTLSKELAELMGGGIRVENREDGGQGSVFTFWLTVQRHSSTAKEMDTPPHTLSEEVKAPAVVLQADQGHSPAAHTEAKDVVLIVEDNLELRQFIRQAISEKWQVMESSNGKEGLEKAVKLLPDLIISDVMMPQKDGYTLCDELKNHELTAHIPIILLTAKVTVDARLKGLRTGADDYLTKPFNTEELLARMDNLVEMRRKLRQHYSQIAVAMRASDNHSEAEFLTIPDREFLRRFTLMVEQHLSDKNFGVEELAQKMLVSRVQLHRKVKAITNLSVSDFMRDYRLDRAMAMLKNHEGNVSEVASRTAFASTKHFARVFREKFGMAPSNIRNT